MKKSGIFFLGLMLLFVASKPDLFSQIKGSSSFDLEKIMKEEALETASSEKLFSNDNIVSGNPVKPDYYMVGPGDVLAMQNLLTTIKIDYLIISPENTVLIPRIGQLSVEGMTLSKAREAIIAKIKETNKDAIAYISLFKPRTVIVTVRGNVKNPGQFAMPASFRVSNAVNQANQDKTGAPQDMGKLSLKAESDIKTTKTESMQSSYGMSPKIMFANRNIAVLHQDGTTCIVDLEKSLVMSDLTLNPYLREGDDIYVPFEPNDFSLIKIVGAVTRPTALSFKSGDKASFLLKCGHSFRYDADLTKITLVSPENGTKQLSVDTNMNITGEDPMLTIGSFIIVGQKKDDISKVNGIVSIVGNINSPGVYPIKRNETRIKDIISSAGGFTKEAYLPLVTIQRFNQKPQSVKPIREEMLASFMNSDLSMYDTAYFFINYASKNHYVPCDFVSLYKSGNNAENVLLEDGDIVSVPSNPGSVYVYGQVKRPGYLPFEENKTLEYYIEKAGGFAPNAEKGRARIIRGNNKVWIKGNSETYLYAGDEIFVPAPEVIPPGTEIQTYAAWGSLVTALTSLISIIIIFRNQK